MNRPGVPAPGFAKRIGAIIDERRNAEFQALDSADLMNRNLDRRVEVLFPIEDERIKERIVREMLEPALADNVKMRWLQMNGSYERPRAAEEKEFNFQEYLLEPALIA